MRLSTKGEYASRAMLELALRHGDPPVHIREISEAQDIPERFLEQILLQLKRFGYLRSRKGPNGGYTLAKPPDRISVAEVIRVMDGPLAPIGCVSVTAHEVCPRERFCGLKGLWKETRDSIAAILEGTSFADLASRMRAVRAGETPRSRKPRQRKAGG
ncbi:MAG: Rrf2 family transcriptional regulator [Candidatus Aminicenantes bacterium]|nr:Rrf2 family transcriptional regulator [Candidatus Aminicenantes bacterium]